MEILVDIWGKLKKLVLWVGVPSLNTLMDPLTRHFVVILAVLSKERDDRKSFSRNLISALHTKLAAVPAFQLKKVRCMGHVRIMVMVYTWKEVLIY